MVRNRTKQEAAVILLERAAAADPQYLIVVDLGIRADDAAKFVTLRPFEFDRGDRQKQRAWKITGAADSGLRDGFLGRNIRELLREVGRRERLDRDEIDRAGHRGSQAVGREARNCPDAGFTRTKSGP